MTRNVCISQPMLFPWVGMLEQIRLADVYVHYDDVQFSKGSLTNRVQIKSAAGPQWLTVPLRNTHLGQPINEVAINEDVSWRVRHLNTLGQAYARAPFLDDMLQIVETVYASHRGGLCELLVDGMRAVLRYFRLERGKTFLVSSKMGVPGKGSDRVLDIVRRVEGDFYITGHGAANYLDHEAFERCGVAVGYMNYERRPYPQLHGEFTPFVSCLDLIANVGRDGASFICSGTVDWKEFVR